MDNEVMELIDQLYTMVSEAWGVPLGNEKCIVERDQVLEILDEIKTAMPVELSEAKRLVSARDEFINNAKREAEGIRNQAEERARALVDDQEIVRIAKARSNEMLASTQAKADALRRASAGRITAVVPYFGYARQDRKAKSRDPISAKLVANMLTASGADRVLTMDLHASQIQGFFDIPVDNLLGNPVFVDYYAKKFGSVCEDMVVVSPDVGSVARARTFAQKLHMGLAIVDKRRQKANQCEVMNVIGDVKGKKCILFDDMVDTAGSLCNAAKAIVEIGGANSVYACASHGVLSGPALERLNNSVIKEVALLNTIPESMGEGCSKIKYISVAPMFAEAIELLGKDIAMIHFKDFLRKDAGGQLAATGAGQGGMEDYRTILRFAKQEKPYIFATLENTTPENAVECLNYLKKQYDEC